VVDSLTTAASFPCAPSAPPSRGAKVSRECISVRVIASAGPSRRTNGHKPGWAALPRSRGLGALGVVGARFEFGLDLEGDLECESSRHRRSRSAGFAERQPQRSYGSRPQKGPPRSVRPSTNRWTYPERTATPSSAAPPLALRSRRAQEHSRREKPRPGSVSSTDRTSGPTKNVRPSLSRSPSLTRR
jgi:hypothetical protein